MNVKQIVKKYLKDNGFDGLCRDDCCCRVENNCLMPCCVTDIEECKPGYLVREERNSQYWGWHISTTKPDKKAGE